jgi:hypothetical protein
VINQNLHRNPVPLDNVQHRQLRVALPVTDWAPASRLNAIFVCATEFTDVGREYPIVFVRVGKERDGGDQIAPVAVLGVTQDQNLYLDGARWRGAYIPAVLRSYPFCIGRVDEQSFAICVDMSWGGVQPAGDDGQALFEGDGKAAPLLLELQRHFELLEGEIQRTREVGARLLELDLLRDMRFDATLPDGRTHTVDGFLTVDQEKAQNLPDAVVGELHRSGVLGMIQLHWASLGIMRRLLEWHVARLPVTAAAQAAPRAGSAA